MAIEEMMPFRPEREPSLADGADTIYASEPDIGAAELELVTSVLRQGWVSGRAPIVGEAERAFAAAVGVEHAVACNSGGSALTLMLLAAGIGSGDEVVVPAYTMAATAFAVSLAGAVPVFADCDAESLDITAETIEKAITPRTRAVICVHIYGHPCAMDEITELCRARGLRLFEDAAEAHGGSWRGRACGSLSEAAAFGFYGNKTITAGEGGMVTTNDADIAARVRSLRNYCFGAEHHYWHEGVGFSSRMPAMSAALCLAQTRRLAELTTRRREVAARYEALIADRCPHVVRGRETGDGILKSWWFYWVRVSARGEMRHKLAAVGIETRPGFVPLHRQPCYAGGRWPFGVAKDGCPVSESAGREVMILPTHSRLSSGHQERVIDALAHLLPG